MKDREQRRSQLMLGHSPKGMKVNDIESIHLKAQGGRNKFYPPETGDHGIQLLQVWDLVSTSGQVCQRLVTLEIIQNEEGTLVSRAPDWARACLRSRAVGTSLVVTWDKPSTLDVPARITYAHQKTPATYSALTTKELQTMSEPAVKMKTKTS